ncbi:MAG: CoA ester lyase [Pseudomonadota bacterium]
MKSALFVPGDSERKLEKAMGSAADALFIDLEDSVAIDAKDDARQIAAAHLDAAKSGSKLWVRVNAFDTGWTEADLDAVMHGHPAGIVLPKCEHASDVERLSAILRPLEAQAGIEDGSTRIIAIITETARGVLNAPSYAEADLPRLAAVTWGAEDLSADTGALRKRDERGRYTDLFRHARTTTLLVANACSVQALDTVYPDFSDAAGFVDECREARLDGFTGKMAIHPAQVAPINEAMMPGPDELTEAQAIVEAFLETPAAGVLSIGGKMVDRPHLRLAKRTLALAGQ